jgi:signal transduction histidine kinase
MGIRFKIALGFAALTIVIISVVSFWAAQSLGVSLDSSDLEKLTGINATINSELQKQQQQLDRLAGETAATLAQLAFFNLDSQQQQRLGEKLKSSLSVDWLEIFHHDSAVLFPNSSFIRPVAIKNRPARIARSGPFSYRGYLAAVLPLPDNPEMVLCLAKKPEFSSAVPMVCVFDSSGILAASYPDPDLAFLQKLAASNVTEQIQVDREVFRARVFRGSDGVHILAGYPAQRASLSRASLDQLMLRLAILEVTGLLLLGYFLGTKLIFPLKELKHAIEQVAAGHWKEIPLDKPPMNNSGDEIETVARSFNHMVRELSTARDRLIEVQKELAKKDKMAALGRFSAGIAHEINNPLGTILVTAGMLKEACASQTRIAPEEFDEIIEEVKRCRDIIVTLRTYTGRTQPGLQTQTFAGFLARMQLQILAEPEFKGADLQFSTEKVRSDQMVQIDEKAMLQVFTNLIKNAMEAVAEVECRTIRIIAESAKDHARIRFQDHGRGFADNQEHIFEPLFTTKAQGTGLGLVICQAIIEGHNGKMEAVRIDENITDFSIMLPEMSPVATSKSEARS